MNDLLLHKRSKINGKHPSDLKPGEIAINYCKGNEFLTIVNSDGEIVEFRPHSYYANQKDVIENVEEMCNKIFNPQQNNK